MLTDAYSVFLRLSAIILSFSRGWSSQKNQLHSPNNTDPMCWNQCEIRLTMGTRSHQDVWCSLCLDILPRTTIDIPQPPSWPDGWGWRPESNREMAEPSQFGGYPGLVRSNMAHLCPRFFAISSHSFWDNDRLWNEQWGSSSSIHIQLYRLYPYNYIILYNI